MYSKHFHLKLIFYVSIKILCMMMNINLEKNYQRITPHIINAEEHLRARVLDYLLFIFNQRLRLDKPQTFFIFIFFLSKNCYFCVCIVYVIDIDMCECERYWREHIFNDFTRIIVMALKISFLHLRTVNDKREEWRNARRIRFWKP